MNREEDKEFILRWVAPRIRVGREERPYQLLADQFPQATSVDPKEVVDLTFVKQVEGAR
jgi:hypothetical protein